MQKTYRRRSLLAAEPSKNMLFSINKGAIDCSEQLFSKPKGTLPNIRKHKP